jgi:4-hydroxy-3-methylbut-2-enyl diphosphate reductase
LSWQRQRTGSPFGKEAKGAIFVNELDAVPDGAPVVFSAHGVAKAVRAEAERRRLPYIDATCPLVIKVHREVEHHVPAGRKVILIGHTGHPEVIGTMGQAAPDTVILMQSATQAAALPIDKTASYGLVTQTTLSITDAEEITTILRRISLGYMNLPRVTFVTRRPIGSGLSKP